MAISGWWRNAGTAANNDPQGFALPTGVNPATVLPRVTNPEALSYLIGSNPAAYELIQGGPGNYRGSLVRIPALANYAERPAACRGTTWLLVGSDSRQDLSPEQQAELATGGDVGNGRTDTILLVHVPGLVSSAPTTMVSIPRDSYVSIPGYGEDKINAAFSIGGAPLLAQTVEGATGMRLDHYAEIGFDGFADMVDAVGGVWPPKGLSVINPFAFPLLNTLILLCSGTTVTWAHHALLHGDRKGMIQGLWCTILLGLTFSGIQAFEYLHAPFPFKGLNYGAAFFMATGFHGFHVIIGTIFLTVCLLRMLNGGFTPQKHFGFEAAAWYWHFVDVVWLFLFACIYVWGSGAEHAAAAAH